MSGHMSGCISAWTSGSNVTTKRGYCRMSNNPFPIKHMPPAKEKVAVDAIIGMLVTVLMETDANSNTICPYHKPVNQVVEKGNPRDHRVLPLVAQGRQLKKLPLNVAVEPETLRVWPLLEAVACQHGPDLGLVPDRRAAVLDTTVR